MCPVNTKPDTESHLVSSSRPLNLPNGPQSRSGSCTRKSNTNNRRPQQQILLIPLPAWMQMYVFCLCLFVIFKFCGQKNCPS